MVSPAESGLSANLLQQEALLPFLLNPRSYPHHPKRLRLLQTHSSFVIVAPPFVYKIKKPVNFGFLDFSTLDKRRHFCERELHLNRRLSPSIYLEVLPISASHGRFSFGSKGRIVEYAVKMKRLAPRWFLHERLRRHELTSRDLHRVAALLRNFYQAQHPSPEITAWGKINRLKISTNENFRQIRAFLGHTLSRAQFEAIQLYTTSFYRKHSKLFQSRVREDRIRDCHGDLHLEHVHLTPTEIHIFDCIEFNDRFRYIDVANDIAFLAMDLDFNGRPDLSRAFVTRMAKALHDPGLLQLMDFYKCYRACVRGKVESLQSMAHAAPPAEREASAERARRYFRLALQYAVAGSTPTALVVMGRIASGKSTLAHSLARELGWPIFSSDRLRKEIAGFPLYERTARAARSHLYSRKMTANTYAALAKSALAELRHGHSVILDATFGDPQHRAQLQARLSAAHPTLRFLEAHVTNQLARQRLTKRNTSTREVSDARLEDFQLLSAGYHPPSELPRKQLLRINTKGSLAQTTSRALKALALVPGQPRPCPCPQTAPS